MIRKVGDKYKLISKTTGKVLGTHPSREKAEKQEVAIEIAKKHREAPAKTGA